MKFSVCIPNYNYEAYLGRTIESILNQSYQDFEILVADNASTDRSVDVIKSFGDPRIRLQVNACNVGFAGNLDRVARMATGDAMIMLSSDDMMRPNALATYRAVWQALGESGRRCFISSAFDVIDSDDRLTGRIGPDASLWTDANRVPDLDQAAGGPVYSVDGPELLRRALLSFKNPCSFLATSYPRPLYEAIEGYGGGRLINPDKWFHWRLLGVADRALFIDQPLFAYRWHPSNQSAQETASGALKFLVDDYAATLELENNLLSRIGLTRDAVARAYVEHDIAGHGLATLARGHRQRARRILHFGKAAYPQHVRKSRNAWLLTSLLAMGPVGQKVAQVAYRSYGRYWGSGRGRTEVLK